MLGPTARRALLIVHLSVSVGWMGAAAAYVALNVPALTGSDEQTMRAAYLMSRSSLTTLLSRWRSPRWSPASRSR